MATPKISTRILQYLTFCVKHDMYPFLCWIDNPHIDFITDAGKHVVIDRPNVKPMPKEYRQVIEQFRPTMLERDGFGSMLGDGNVPVNDKCYWFADNEQRLMTIGLILTMLKEKGL